MHQSADCVVTERKYVYKLLKLEYFAFWQYNYGIDLNHIKFFKNTRVKYLHSFNFKYDAVRILG